MFKTNLIVYYIVLDFVLCSFEFVSCFVLRISNFYFNIT